MQALIYTARTHHTRQRPPTWTARHEPPCPPRAGFHRRRATYILVQLPKGAVGHPGVGFVAARVRRRLTLLGVDRATPAPTCPIRHCGVTPAARERSIGIRWAPVPVRVEERTRRPCPCCPRRRTLAGTLPGPCRPANGIAAQCSAAAAHETVAPGGRSAWADRVSVADGPETGPRRVWSRTLVRSSAMLTLCWLWRMTATGEWRRHRRAARAGSRVSR